MAEVVGIVLVSHSADLASGLGALLAQLGAARVEPAGGTDDGGLGTSYALIRAAVARADAGAGVVILPDLGSAVLTARMVVEELGPSVVIVDAPFVEGAVSAAVTASTGADLAAVVAAAQEARNYRKL